MEPYEGIRTEKKWLKFKKQKLKAVIDNKRVNNNTRFSQNTR